jgi:hypothetical protein
MTIKSSNPPIEQINRAKELLKIARHAAIATVNADGSPHNTPLYLILDDALEHFYFASHPESLHVQNVVRTGELFAVIYDMMERGGLYMKAVGGHELSGAEYEAAMAAHNKKRIRDGKDPIPPGNYQLRMYGADLVNFWVNAAERNEQGWVIRDYRQEIVRESLL